MVIISVKEQHDLPIIKAQYVPGIGTSAWKTNISKYALELKEFQPNRKDKLLFYSKSCHILAK